MIPFTRWLDKMINVYLFELFIVDTLCYVYFSGVVFVNIWFFKLKTDLKLIAQYYSLDFFFHS